MPSAVGRLAALALVPLICGCADEQTACTGFADRKLAVTGAEYRPCASEILAALDAMESPLRALVAKKAKDEDQNTARQAYRRLRALIRQTGIEHDYRSFRPSTVIVKWSDASVSSFNSAAFTASVQYMAVLAYPNADNLAQGTQAHADARRYYRFVR